MPACAKLFTDIIIPILEVRKLRLREAKELAQVATDAKDVPSLHYDPCLRARVMLNLKRGRMDRKRMIQGTRRWQGLGDRQSWVGEVGGRC